MTIRQNGDILDKLSTFLEELKSYQRLTDSSKKLSQVQQRYKDNLRDTLVEKAHALKQIITELTGKQRVSIPIYGIISDMWDEGLRPFPAPQRQDALKLCIDAVIGAIGKLKSDIEKGYSDKHGNVIGEPPKDTAELPVNLFDKMQFHPRVAEASKSCFVTGNYREAILNAFIRLIDYVKEITGLDLDGDDLMNKVFSFYYDKDLRKITKYPIIRINELKNSNDRNEQQGFMFLCKGAAGGIRNPKAHKLIPQSNPLHTLEYLAFASLLMRRIEEGKLELKEQSS